MVAHIKEDEWPECGRMCSENKFSSSNASMLFFYNIFNWFLCVG